MRRSAPFLVTPILTALALASCAAPPPKQVAPPPPAPPKPAEVQTAGCLDIARIREARVIDDRTIDFHMNDGRVVRSALPAACPGLAAEKAFTYATTLTRLCPGDTINVVNQSGGPRLGASCALGAMTPMAAPGS